MNTTEQGIRLTHEMIARATNDGALVHGNKYGYGQIAERLNAEIDAQFAALPKREVTAHDLYTAFAESCCDMYPEGEMREWDDLPPQSQAKYIRTAAALLQSGDVVTEGTPKEILAPQEPKPPEGTDGEPSEGMKRILAERKRQVMAEGWKPEEDDRYLCRELMWAAHCYANGSAEGPNWYWPWDGKWWKPTTELRNLEKAGALYLAEKERYERSGFIPNPRTGDLVSLMQSKTQEMADRIDSLLVPATVKIVHDGTDAGLQLWDYLEPRTTVIREGDEGEMLGVRDNWHRFNKIYFGQSNLCRLRRPKPTIPPPQVEQESVGMTLSDSIWKGKTSEEDAALREHLRGTLVDTFIGLKPIAQFSVGEKLTANGHGWRITISEVVPSDPQPSASSTNAQPPTSELAQRIAGRLFRHAPHFYKSIDSMAAVIGDILPDVSGMQAERDKLKEQLVVVGDDFKELQAEVESQQKENARLRKIISSIQTLTNPTT